MSFPLLIVAFLNTANANDASFQPPEPTPVFAAPETTQISAAHADLSLARYYRNQSIAKVGLGVGLGGLGVVVVGTTVIVGGIASGSGEVVLGGAGLVVLGGLGYVVGAPMAIAGSLSARGNQRSVGLKNSGTAGWVGLGLAVGGLALGVTSRTASSIGGLAFLGSYVACGVQMGVNGRAMDASGQSRVGAVRVRPLIDPYNKRVLLVATF